MTQRAAGPAGAELPRPAAPRRSIWATRTTATATRRRGCSPRSSGSTPAQYVVTFQSRFGKRRVAAALHRGHRGRAGEGGGGPRRRRSARASSPTASRRWRKSASRAGRRSSRPGAGNSTPSPASTSSRRGSRRLTDLVWRNLAGLADAAARRRRPRADAAAGQGRWAPGPERIAGALSTVPVAAIDARPDPRPACSPRADPPSRSNPKRLILCYNDPSRRRAADLAGSG